MRKELASPSPDLVISRIGGNQHGVVSAAQLKAAGFSQAGLTRRVKSGRLHRIHRGVYAVAHPQLNNEGKWMAAVLAAGDGAVLSHRAAGQLWEILSRDGAVEVTVPGHGGRAKRNGIKLHRSATLRGSHCTRRHGIPVTKPGRTLDDLRPILSPVEYARAVREAEFLGLPLDERLVTDRAHTELERRFLSLCRLHRFPQPEVNTRLDRYEVDFLWQQERLVVEVDGWKAHRTRSAFEQDRARDAKLAVLGYEVIRFTWLQVTEQSQAVAETIRALLDAR